MATNLQELQVAINGEKDDDEEQKFLEQPMSPSSQCFNTSILCYSILAFLEFESEIIDSKISQHLQKLLPILNPRFTSTVLRNDDGTQRWRKLNVDMVHLDEDHIKVAEFPKGLTPKDYDKHLEDYAFAIHKEGFPEGKPLWQVHLIKYPTSNAVSTLIFKLHHVLGDGYSLMGILLSCLQRVDDPSLPITFPTSTKLLKKNTRNCSQGLKFVSVCWNTVLDFGDSVIQSMLGEDDKTVIRSGKPGLESEPISISSISLSLQDISLVKSKVNGVTDSQGIKKLIILSQVDSLGIYIMSYMDKLRLVVTAEKEFIDSELLVSCMKEAFQNIYEASSWDDKDREVFLQKP
ncbi:hypothetical protein MKX03_027450 [Papaver bracteatum]|nr:hypothetical protein MKX03_027450 [Papaver bracteatum]